jgi:antitoxin component HigA of HigAB toxin-antitoxin module
MKSQFDIEAVLKAGKISSELEYERSMIADRKLRLLSKNSPKLKSIRKALREIIEQYEDENWSSTSSKTVLDWKESDLAELIAERERQFIQKRKNLIVAKLKKAELNQQHLMKLLGLTSKTHMSELMNGLSPFTLNHIVIIHRLFKIEFSDLIPTTLPQVTRIKIQSSIRELGNPKLKLSAEDFDLVC